jgi:transcriptional regulator with XRE-family HTH domain
MASRSTAGRIREERERLGLSIARVGRMIGIRPDSYRQLEYPKAGDANPSLQTLAKLVTGGFRLEAIAPDLISKNEILSLIPGVDSKKKNVLVGETGRDEQIIRRLVHPAWGNDVLWLIRKAIVAEIVVIIRSDHPTAGQVLDGGSK